MKKFMIGFAIAGIILIGLSSCLQIFGQTLPRRGWLGVSAKAPDEAAVKANALKPGEGLVVVAVVAGGTFAELGVKPGDVVLTVNQKATDTPAALVAAAQALTEGDAIEVTFVTGGARQTKKGTAKGRPKENSDNADVNYDAVEMALGTLRTITYIPKNKPGKLPAVFYLQGFPCDTQELGPNSKDPRKMAYEDWVKAGFVVFRVERPNLGDSRTTKDCRDIDFDEELAVNKAGYKKLLSYAFVDPDNVFFFGHSMGAVTAPLVAQMKQPKGIIVYGVAVRSWFEYFIDINRIQLTYAGVSLVDAERETRATIPFLYEWLEAGKSPDELRKNPDFKALMDAPDSSWRFNGNYFNGRSANFWYTMNKQRLGEAWSKVTGKVLAMHGEFDVQAINSRDAETIAAFVNETHPGNGEYLFVPKTEHIFMKVGSHRQVFELIASGKYLEYGQSNYNPEIGRLTDEWMLKVMRFRISDVGFRISRDPENPADVRRSGR